MSAPPPTEAENYALVLINDVTSQLRGGGQPNAATKAIIRRLLEKVGVSQEAPSTPSASSEAATSRPGTGVSEAESSRAASPGSALESSGRSGTPSTSMASPEKKGPSTAKKHLCNPHAKAECTVCGQERAGFFQRTGFKCAECFGHASHGPSIGQSEYHVPASVLPAAFDLHPLQADEPSDVFPGPAQSRYGVLRLPLHPSMTEAAVASFRPLYHPSFLYNYAIARDTKRNCLWVVHENAARLDPQQPMSPRRRNQPRSPSHDDVDFDEDLEMTSRIELGKQAAMAALHGLCQLHFVDIPHHDVRLDNFFVDSIGCVKLRLAPFPDEPLPAPYTDPLKPVDPSGARSMRERKAGDVFALGVSLSVLVFGTYPPPQQPTFSAAGDFANLVAQLTEPTLEARLTVAAALETRFLQSVRVVNGVAMETMFAKIRLLGDAPQSATAVVAGQDMSLASFDQVRSIEDDIMFAPMNTAAGAADGAFATPDMAAAQQLADFIHKEGPVFQVVRTVNSITLYGKSDPRRPQRQRQAVPSVSFRLPNSSVASGGTGVNSLSGSMADKSSPATRRRSVTIC